MRFLFLCALLGCALGCTDANRTSTATNDPRFHMSDPNELFFRNTRQNKYRLVRDAVPSQDVYRVYALNEVSTRPQIFAQVVLNWLEDEAYLFIETNAYNAEFQQPLTLATQAGDRIELRDYSPAAQLAFAETLAPLLQRESALEVYNAAGETVSIFQTKPEREAFLVALDDFYRLTAKK